MQEPNLAKVWESFTGYQRTAAIKAAIDLDVFTEIAAGATSIEVLSQRTQAAARGLRALLNHLVMDGYLEREAEKYVLSPTAAAFLDRNSPAYVGAAITFLSSPMLLESFSRLSESVRRGGTAVSNEGTLAPEHPVWVEFARAMAPLAAMTGSLVGNLLEVEKGPNRKVLDVAAGHGMFGIALAKMNPGIEVTALDWRNVLAVAETNARAAGVADRFHTLPGSAFDVPWGEGYDLVLLPNFLHHFDRPTCEEILRKAHAALVRGGRVVIVEFVPDEDQSGPPDAVRFELVMLASTPAGDAYTFAQYQEMIRNSGFGNATIHDLPPSPARVVIATK